MILKNFSKRKTFLLLGDIAIIVLSINLAFMIRLNRTIVSCLGFDGAFLTILLILSISLTSLYTFDLYNIRQKFTSIGSLANMIFALALMSLFSISLFYVFPYVIGRGVFSLTLILVGILISIWRLSYSFFFRLAISKRNILIVGTGKSAQAIYSIAKKNPEYKVVGFICDESPLENNPELRVWRDPRLLEKIVEDYAINDIVVTGNLANTNKEFGKTLISSRMKGIAIYDIARFYEYLTGKINVRYIEDTWLLFSDGFNKLGSKINKGTKRVLDILLSSFFLVIFSPIGLIISIAIKLTSRGPIFLIQERVGEKQKHFDLIKFRTMIADAEKEKPKWAEDNDPRVTRVGKMLRKTRLDELPQFINVIRGDMSIVGPRPEREFFVKQLMKKIPFYALRFFVKPGLTGWAQVNYRYGASKEDALEKLQYELYYIKNMSLILDLRILLKTIRVVLFGMGK